MQKKIVAIIGSPRLKGESGAMVDLAFAEFPQDYELKKISLAEFKIKPCIACGLCKKELTCSIQDDGMIGLYNDLIQADALIFASPTYMGGMSAQMKAFVDRTVALRRNGFLLKDKLGAVLAVGGSRNGGQELVITQLHAFLHIHGMLPVGDDNHFGATVHAPLEKDEFGKETIVQTARKLVRLLAK